jgi:hypothetical protein
VQELPRSGLRIVLFEVGEKRMVGEVLESRGIVCHDVVRSWEVGGEVAVAVEALVGARVVAQEGCWPVTGHCPLADSRNCRGVVASIGESGVSDVVSGCHEGYLAKEVGVL